MQAAAFSNATGFGHLARTYGRKKGKLVCAFFMGCWSLRDRLISARPRKVSDGRLAHLRLSESSRNRKYRAQNYGMGLRVPFA